VPQKIRGGGQKLYGVLSSMRSL